MPTKNASKYRGVTIRRRTNSWQVDFGSTNGKRVQRSYPIKQDAKQAIDDHLERSRIESVDTKNRRVAVYDLTDRQRIDVISAFDKLPSGSSLTEAVEFFAEHHGPHGGHRTVSEVLDEYLEEKTKANRRDRTIEDIQTRISRLAKTFGSTCVHQITTHDLERWLDEHNYRCQSRINYRRHFIAFLNFALKRGYTRSNPASSLERVSLDERVPEVFLQEEARELMRCAQRQGTRMVPYFAVGLFAGLRPAEIEQLEWRDIDIPARRIRVRPEVAKKRRQRYVDIPDNLALWLAPYRQEAGVIYFGRYEFDKIRREGNIRWASDIMRHSYGSYHLALHEDAPRTALQMGHSRTDVLFQHYRDLVKREDAESFFDIRPDSRPGVIEISATG
jgi:integrase